MASVESTGAAMRRLMLAERYRAANSFYFGMSWRSVVAACVVYLVWRMV